MYRPLPESVTISKSYIEGLGLFANKDLSNQVEKSREEMIEMFDNPSFVKQLKDGEINVNDTVQVHS